MNVWVDYRFQPCWTKATTALQLRWHRRSRRLIGNTYDQQALCLCLQKQDFGPVFFILENVHFKNRRAFGANGWHFVEICR